MINILNTTGRNADGFKTAVPADIRTMWNKFIDDMTWNNTYCPEPTRVIYNVGTKAYPVLDAKGKRQKDENGEFIFGEPVKVLTTVVFFDDETKCTVTNSEHDGVQFTTVHAIPDDPNSPEVEVATEASKEMGFVYATLKRLMGYPDDNGTILGDGFGRRLREIVTEAYDTKVEEAANKYRNKLAKVEYDKKQGTAKPKRPSFAETVVDLRAAVDGMNQMINTLKTDLESIKAAK